MSEILDLADVVTAQAKQTTFEIREEAALALRQAGTSAPPEQEVLKQFVRIYAQRQFRHCTTVVHQGKVIAFAMDAARRIVYSTLDLDRGTALPRDNALRELRDLDFWDTDPEELQFPTEIDRVGYEVAGPYPMPVVTLSGSAPVDGSPVEPSDVDRFRSSTARLTAGLPFQALSDGTYIYLFRQSIPADDSGMVFIRHWDGGRIPVVDSSLLVDRFLHVKDDGRWRLQPSLEARFQRSRNRSMPASRKDTLGAADLQQQPFVEPTHELPVGRLQDGRFTVLLVPTAIPDVRRWLIFLARSQDEGIDLWTIREGEGTSFDTRGTRLYTCPIHPTQVFERQPGRCPVDGKDALVPIEEKKAHAPSCLRFKEKGQVHCGTWIDLRDKSFTFELWVRRDKLSFITFPLSLGLAAKMDELVHCGFRENNCFTFDFYGNAFDVPTPVTDNLWHHWACVYDYEAARQRIYMDGRLVAEREKKNPFQGQGALVLGGWPPELNNAYPFSGWLNEVRVWARARTGEEIEDDMHFRLLGREPGLLAYWRLDEGNGTTITDLTGNGHHGTFNSNEVQWQESAAPVEDHPGIDHARFRFKDRSIVSGLTAVLYAQQENATVGYEQEQEPMKRAQRVMLAAATVGTGSSKAEIAVLDFGVSPYGKPALAEGTISLPLLEANGTKDVSMPLVGIDPAGLSLYGGVLRFAYTGSGQPNPGPQLFEAANRRVNLYFRGAQDQFFVAHYDTLTARARFALPAAPNSKPVRLLARTAGPAVDGAVLQVEDDTGKDPELCNVTFQIQQPARTESWKRVPRDPRLFAAVLLGENVHFLLSLGDLIDKVEGSSIVELPLAKKLGRSIPQGTALTAGKVQVTTSKIAEPGDSKISILPAALALEKGTHVKLGIHYSYAEHAPGLAHGSRLFLADAGEATVPVINGKASLEGPNPTPGCRWIADAPGTAFRFDPGHPKLKDVAVGVAGDAAAHFARKQDLTLEAWVLPREQPEEQGCLVLQRSGDQGYTLGLTALPSALHLTKTEQYVEVAAKVPLTSKSFTIMAWARADEKGTDYRSVVTLRDDQGSNRKGFTLYVTDQDRWTFHYGTTDANGTQIWEQKELGPVELKRWTHLAASYDDGNKTLTVYLDGKAKSSILVPKGILTDHNRPLRIGAGEHAQNPSNYFYPGAVDEVRLWKRALSDQELARQWDRRLGDSERSDKDLIGYWYFEARSGQPSAANRGNFVGSQLDGVIKGSPATVRSPVSSFLPSAGCGGRLARGSRPVLARRWNHLAAVYRQAYALRFQGPAAANPETGDYVDCGASRELDIAGDLTIEAAVQPANFGTDLPILVKGNLAASGRSDGKLPYALWLEKTTGALVFAFVDEQGETRSFRSSNVLPLDGKLHRVAVTRERASTGVIFKIDDKVRERLENKVPTDVSNELKKLGTLEFPDRRSFLGKIKESLKGVPDAPRWYSIILSESKAPRSDGYVEPWWEIAFSIDGAEAGFHKYMGANPGGNDRPLEIGRRPAPAAGGLPAYFIGLLGEVRLWNVARADSDLWAQLDGGEQGLVAWWRCDDGEGRTLSDAKGNNPGQCHGTQWAAVSPGSQIELFFNGIRDPRPVLESWSPEGSDQLTLGGRFNKEIQDRRFSGLLDEVRIWSMARTPEQLADNLFRRLTDEREELIAYFDGEASGTPEVRDQSAYGHHLVARVRTEVAQFSNANNYVTLAIPPAANVWELWFKPQETSSSGSLLWAPDCFQASWDETQARITAGAYLTTQKGKEWITVSHTGVDRKQWCHVAAAVAAGVLFLYVDGKLVARSAVLGKFAGSPNGQLALGGGGSKPSFRGLMKDFRLWKRQEVDESWIRSLRFAQLTGQEKELIGGWPLGKQDQGKFPNLKPGGSPGTPVGVVSVNDYRNLTDPAVFQELYATSTAPISGESAEVRSALAGIETDFHGTIGSRPSVQEYGRVEPDGRGGTAAVLKRCYTYLQNGAWHLTTGFKVGDLDLEWISQVQYDPQLIGFIEGAPPVPSENMTIEGHDYTGASSIALSEAEDTVQTYSRASYGDLGVSISYKAGLGLKSKSLFGYVVLTSTEEHEVEAGIQGNISLSRSWLATSDVSLGTSRNKLSRMELTGAWGTKGTDEKRFMPSNVGFALVQSETADLFALRLRHSQPERRALVAFSLRPNADIPKDWNILTFRINPSYQKQGVLDGKVGLASDPDYQQALSGNIRHNSYFKPSEAYSLKARITREEERLKVFYQSFGAVFARQPEPWRRNMVNTYVWTADGGLFQETERTMDVRQELRQTEWGMSFGFGAYSKMDLVLFKLHVRAELEVMSTGGFRFSSQKTASSQTSYGMEVAVSPKTELRTQGKPIPGKVDAYRFLTFYLAPSKDHFDDFANRVVDRKWLTQSQDPNAVALRHALRSKNGTPWRVLHRVTFVSRQLPKAGATKDPVEQALQLAHIESNYELMRTLEPFVKSKTGDPRAFRDAAREAIRLYLPELDRDGVRERVVEYAALFFEVAAWS